MPVASANLTNLRTVKFFFCRWPGSAYVDLGCTDPEHRWSFPFQFLDCNDLREALKAAGLPTNIAYMTAPVPTQVCDEQLDILAYWLQGGVRN